MWMFTRDLLLRQGEIEWLCCREKYLSYASYFCFHTMVEKASGEFIESVVYPKLYAEIEGVLCGSLMNDGGSPVGYKWTGGSIDHLWMTESHY